jgi:hypothetical protein
MKTRSLVLVAITYMILDQVQAQDIPAPPATTSRASMAYGDERGCRRGDMLACANLARLLYDGFRNGMQISVAQDRPRAIQLFIRSCGAGNPVGCDGLGRHYERTEHDEVRAHYYYRWACWLNHGMYSDGCTYLWRVYRFPGRPTHEVPNYGPAVPVPPGAVVPMGPGVPSGVGAVVTD